MRFGWESARGDPGYTARITVPVIPVTPEGPRPIRELVQRARDEDRPTLFRKGITRRFLAALEEYSQGSPLLSALAMGYGLSFDIHAMRHGGACWLKYEKGVPPEYLTAKADWADDSWSIVDRYTKIVPKELQAMIGLECDGTEDVSTALVNAALRARGETSSKRLLMEPEEELLPKKEKPRTGLDPAMLEREIDRELKRQSKVESEVTMSQTVEGGSSAPGVDGKPGVRNTARNGEGFVVA